MPPIQCVRLRHKSRLGGSASTSVSMLAPVVVKPDMTSNRASVKLGVKPDSQSGSAPTRLIAIQPRETAAKPSFEYIDLSCGFTQQDTSPAASAKLADRANAVPTPSPEINASAVGMSINAPTASSTQPTKYLTML